VTTQNRNVHPNASSRFGISHVIDMSLNAGQASVVAFSPTRRIKLRSATVVHVVDGDTGTVAALQLGIQGDLAKYGTITTSIVAANNGSGDIEAITLLNATVLLAKNTPLLANRASGAATNIGEMQMHVEYELID